MGQILSDRYELLRRIGLGGMGVVYEATDLKLERRVAVKLIRHDLAHKKTTQARFQREARAAGRIGHDNVCEVTDLGEAPDGSPFLVMPLLVGEPLSAVIKAEGALPLPRVDDIAVQVLSALQAAHGAGVVHRDLKPANIFLATVGDRRDFVKILDFGISKLDVGSKPDETPEALTQTGAALGTPHYMSPEQARGDKTSDARADLYAFGVILYEMLTATRPFVAESASELLWKIWNEPVAPPRTLRPDLARDVEEVVLRAMARDPEERFGTAEALHEAWSVALDAAGPGASSEPSTLPTQELADESPTMEEASPPGSRIESQKEDETSRHFWSGSWRRGALIGVALTIAVVTGAALTSDRRQPRAEMQSSIVTTTTTSGVEVDIEPVPAVGVSEPRPARSKGDAAPSTRAEADARPVEEIEASLVRILLSGVPDGARITVDGRAVDRPAFDVAESEGEVLVVVEHEGSRPWSQVVPTSSSQTIPVRLRPSRRVETWIAGGAAKKRSARARRAPEKTGAAGRELTPFGEVP